MTPAERIEVSAPVRICDLGGWTDTWFGGPGRVLNVAVSPGVEVSIGGGRPGQGVVLDVAALGDRYAVQPGAPRAPRHALLEAAIDMLPPPPDRPVEITVRSAVPAGCGAGTSAAVAVSLLGALSALRGEELTPREAAYAAHRLEVDVLGMESGIQDQLSAALGGINYLEIDHYPDARVQRLPPWEELGARLTLVFLGRAHDSSGVHRQVIAGIAGGSAGPLSVLRDAAARARDAVVDRDLRGFGRAMILNTEAQMALHPGLVGTDARRVIEAAGRCQATGWKVNGAGGEGGSVTILSATPTEKDAVEAVVASLRAEYRVLPIRISDEGLTVRSDP